MQSVHHKRKRSSPHFSLVTKKSRTNTPIQAVIDSTQQTRRDLQDISTINKFKFVANKTNRNIYG